MYRSGAVAALLVLSLTGCGEQLTVEESCAEVRAWADEADIQGDFRADAAAALKPIAERAPGELGEHLTAYVPYLEMTKDAFGEAVYEPDVMEDWMTAHDGIGKTCGFY